MQQENKNDSVQLSSRYQQYMFAKGHLRGTRRPEVFPIGEASNESIQTKKLPEQISNTLRTNYSNGHSNEVYVSEATKKGYAEATKGDSINYSVPNSKIRRGRVGKKIANTLDTACQQGTLSNILERKSDKLGRIMPLHRKTRCGIRRLTPKECERLQGFPDDWTQEGIDENGEIFKISDTQRYKMCGNAVTVNVIKEIMLKLL